MKMKSLAPVVRVAIDMTPMIDVVFQLMIFFMLTLKIKKDEGDFNINMPLGKPISNQSTDPLLPDLKVRLVAGEGGRLSKLMFGERNLGNNEKAFQLLNDEIRRIIGAPGGAMNSGIEVELDPDYEVNYQSVMQAISACTGKIDPNTKEVVRYIEKVKFATPREKRKTDD